MHVRDEKGRIVKGSIAYNKGVYSSKRKMYEAGLPTECIHHGVHSSWYYNPKKNVLACRMCCCNRSKKYNNKEEYKFRVFAKWARTRNREFDITEQFLEDLFESQNKICAISGLPLNRRNMSLDRIDSNIGYIESNLQWVDKNVNRMKSNFSEQEFIDMCNKIANYNILKSALRSAGAPMPKKKK